MNLKFLRRGAPVRELLFGLMMGVGAIPVGTILYTLAVGCLFVTARPPNKILVRWDDPGSSYSRAIDDIRVKCRGAVLLETATPFLSRTRYSEFVALGSPSACWLEAGFGEGVRRSPECTPRHFRDLPELHWRFLGARLRGAEIVGLACE